MSAIEAEAATAPPLAAASETGALGVYQLKRLWSRVTAARQGRFAPTSSHERHLDYLVVHACGLGLEQTVDYLGAAAPSFGEFERWIVATAGGIAPDRVARINSAAAPAISSSGTKRCRMAPAPTAGGIRAWCNTSTCFRRASSSRRNGSNHA